MVFGMPFRILQILRRNNRHGKLLAASGKLVFASAVKISRPFSSANMLLLNLVLSVIVKRTTIAIIASFFDTVFNQTEP